MQFPIQYHAALALAEQASSLKNREWPSPFFPVHHHAEQMAAEAMRLQMGSQAVMAAILHDLVLMTPMTLDDIERIANEETADLIQAMTPDTRVLSNPDQFDFTDYTAHIARSNSTVQTLVLMDWIQTASFIGTSKTTQAQAFQLCLMELANSLSGAPGPLHERARLVANWLERRQYEKKVAQYTFVPTPMEYVLTKS